MRTKSTNSGSKKTAGGISPEDLLEQNGPNPFLRDCGAFFDGIAKLPGVGATLSVVAGLLFLALCMSLPLVGKAATHGSGSPGAGPIPSLQANLLWFWGLWIATSLVTAAAIALRSCLASGGGKSIPRHLWALAAVLLLLAVAQPAGWLAL